MVAAIPVSAFYAGYPINSAFTTSVPHLQTERLLLREFRREDFDAYADHFADRMSAAHLISTDRQTVWRIFCSIAGLWIIHGAGWWAVEERRTGQLVGNVGAFFREESPVMELGWNTCRAFWAKDSRAKRRRRRRPCITR
jgi:RimJ/RimL family protein N-acetyltransferase